MPSSDLSRLCTLINASLRPYTEREHFLVSKEKEKDLLILLSQISREIKLWANDVDCNSDEEIDGKKCVHGLEPFSGKGCNCLANIISVLVFFLTMDNHYVRHLAGNIFVVISNFLIESGSKWEEFVHLLCVGLEVAISSSSLLVSLPAGSVTVADESLTHCYSHATNESSGATNSDYDTPGFILFLQPRLVDADWFTVTSLIRVLRNILKSLRKDHRELMEVYIRSFTYSISNAPWVLLHEIHVGTGGTWMKSRKDDLCHRNIGSLESKGVFLGALLQLFCSLVDSNGLEEIRGSFLDASPFLAKVTDFVPKLFCWCLCNHRDNTRNRLSQYLRHKLLVLLMRLSFHIHGQYSILVKWLQLLRKHFGDVLSQPIYERHVGVNDSLEGSPFMASIAYGQKVHNICSRHLQRQVIFILFKCSFSLISFKMESGQQCACATENPCLTCELQTNREFSCTMGLSELSEWLHRHVPLEKFVAYEDYLWKCKSFASSFLELYVDEDDFLFEMLLQLLSLPFPGKLIQPKENGNILEEAKGDILFHISSIFNPIHLFHLFLAGLHYDHSVLLDYLISKDTGIHCVQYLLRSLRIVCKSWCMFVEFSVGESELRQSYCKKRKICNFMSGRDCEGKVDLSSSSMKEIANARIPERQNKQRHSFRSMPETDRPLLAFGKAKECLLSLKKSVENLHQKNLFPYNPAALLRRFRGWEHGTILVRVMWFGRSKKIQNGKVDHSYHKLVWGVLPMGKRI
ncbi:golgin isoform X2 [Tasmannia lanceolata]|uniref:golgin isoform X2 n=1 Tax=Tasmannia lanceolata TaxID=3420 RepID=UPI004064388E